MVTAMYGYEASRDGLVRSDSAEIDHFSIDTITDKMPDVGASTSTITGTRPINIATPRSTRKTSFASSITTSRSSHRPHHSRGYSGSSRPSVDYTSASTTPTTIASDYASTAITSPSYSTASASLRHAYSATSKRRSPRLSFQNSPAGSPVQEDYRRFSLDERRSSSTHHISKTRIVKPLLKPFKAPHRTSSNSLDLSQPGGGEGGAILGLGIYQDPFFYDSSDFDGDLFMSRHRRNTSGGSYHGSTPTHTPAWGNATYAHPKRQTPRPYTPSPSYACSSADTSDDESAMPTPRARASLDRSRPSMQSSLRVRTDTVTISGTCTPTTSTPILTTPNGFSSISKKHTVVIPPPLSPTFETAVQQERMKWDKKEAIKEEKALQKARRRSNHQERRSFEDATYSLSPVLGGSLESIHSLSSPTKPSKKDRKRSWDLSSKRGSKKKSSSEVDKAEEDRSSRESLGGDTFISLGCGAAVVEEPEELEEEYNSSSPRQDSSLEMELRAKEMAVLAEKDGKGPGGLKKGWQEFVMWCRIKLIRMRRKLKGKKGSKKGCEEKNAMAF